MFHLENLNGEENDFSRKANKVEHNNQEWISDKEELDNEWDEEAQREEDELVLHDVRSLVENGINAVLNISLLLNFVSINLIHFEEVLG